MERLREAVRPLPKAALFELRDDYGFRSVFQQLVACIISIRTRDEVAGPVARRLFERAPDPAAVAELTPEQMADLIRPSTVYENKARQIHSICDRGVAEHERTHPLHQ